jgi:hypothetical protein
LDSGKADLPMLEVRKNVNDGLERLAISSMICHLTYRALRLSLLSFYRSSLLLITEPVSRGHDMVGRLSKVSLLLPLVMYKKVKTSDLYGPGVR